ncbi:hypothetical protein [Patiriisocius sp. Uisw_017]
MLEDKLVIEVKSVYALNDIFLYGTNTLLYDTWKL